MQRQLANLAPYNSMALACIADGLLLCETEQQAVTFFASHKQRPFLVLSGGSNVILPPKLHADVIHPVFTGITLLEETSSHVLVEVMAGENWHNFVLHTVAHGWYGLENLALIPGLVGAAPIQNIGAYGVEVKDHLHSVRALHIATGQWHELANSHCRFGYRDSMFKQQPNTWFISRVRFKLKKQPMVQLNYGDLKSQAGQNPTPQSVMQAVIHIRKAKLPNPEHLPNCGSFFKNPIVSQQQLNTLLVGYPTLVHYPLAGGRVKLAAGWLIDKAGLKGKGVVPILTHSQQALVLTNHQAGVSTQQHVAAACEFIVQQVHAHFGVTLYREPVWVNADATLV